MYLKSIFQKTPLIVTVIFFFQLGCSNSINNPELNLKVYHISQLPQEHNFYSVEFINEEFGWAVGKNGIIVHTINGGETWTVQNSFISDDLIKIQFFDKQNGWIASTNNVLSTNDGGNTWKIKLSNVALSRFVSMSFVNKNFGSVSGTPDGKIYHTSDAGSTWSEQQVDTMGRVVDLSYINNSTIYLLRNITGIYKSLNGGQSWNKVNLPRFCSTIFFRNVTDGFAGNNVMPSSIAKDKAEIFMTKDEGETWIPKSIPDATAVWKISFVNSLVGLAISGGICGFSDEGADWVKCGDLIYSSNGGYDWKTFDPNLSLKKVIDFKTYNSNNITVLTKSGKIHFLKLSN